MTPANIEKFISDCGLARHSVHNGDLLDLRSVNDAVLIVEGFIDIYAVIDQSGNTVRHQLARFGAGDVVVGFDGSADGIVIEYNCRAGTIVQFSLEAEFAKGEARDLLADSLDHWVKGIAFGKDGLAKLPSDQSAVLAATIGSEPIEVGTLIHSKQLVWISCVEDSALWYLSQRPIGKAQPVALTPELWVEVQAEIAVELRETAALGDDLLIALAGHHMVVASLIVEQIVKQRNDEVGRIEQRRVRDSETLAQASTLLAREADPRQTATVQIVGDNPLFAAAKLVTAAGGITLNVPKAGMAALDATDDPIAVLAEAAGCEYRSVSLSGHWWKLDNEPLVVFRDEDVAPLALIPDTHGSAELIDPVTGHSQKLTAKVASTLMETAIMFYPALPSAPTNFRGLFGLGAHRMVYDSVLALLMLVLVGIASMVTPIVVGEITGSVVQEARTDQLKVLIFGLIVAAFASVGFTLVQSIAVLRMEGRFDLRAQSAIWIRLMRLPSSFFRRFSVGDLASRALGIEGIRKIVTTSVLSAMMSTATAVFSLILMFYYDWLLALCATAVLMLYVGVMVWMSRLAATRQRLMLDQQGRLQSLMLQLLQSVSKLRVTSSEARGYAKWAAMYAKGRQLFMARQKVSVVIPVINAVMTFVGLTLFIAVIALQADQFFGPDLTTFSWRAIDDATLAYVINPADFLAFFTAYGQVFAAITSVSQVVLNLVGAVPLRDRMDPILAAPTETQEDGEYPGVIKGGIEVSNVEFRYREDLPLVLKGLSLEIEPGSFVGIVGPSGAGKSSLIRLLLGFDEAESGSIFFDGKDLSRLDKRALRRQFGVVLQNGRLLTGSIFENIIGGGTLTEEDAWEAARMAGFDKDVENMPMKMHTMVAEGGATLSGGQRQRLMIARAIVRKPRVLIFDEATSALDNETQKIVSDSLTKLDSTRIAIAHRLSTIVDADKIFVIDQGIVVEQGTYAELMAMEGVFARLAKRQIA